MLKYAIISKNEESIKEYEGIIDRIMMPHTIYYDNYSFNGNSKSFKEFCIDHTCSNVFIIEESSLIDSVKLIQDIRNKYELLVAFIVVIDQQKRLNKNAISKEHSFLIDIITDKNLNERLEKDLKDILKIVYNRKKVFAFYEEKVLYSVPFDDILYIEKELNGKKSIIVTKNGSYKTYQSITQIIKKLDESFIKSHQSAIINKKNVKCINCKNNEIVFTNNSNCNLISRNYKKELKNLFAKCE